MLGKNQCCCNDCISPVVVLFLETAVQASQCPSYVNDGSCNPTTQDWVDDLNSWNEFIDDRRFTLRVHLMSDAAYTSAFTDGTETYPKDSVRSDISHSLMTGPFSEVDVTFEELKDIWNNELAPSGIPKQLHIFFGSASKTSTINAHFRRLTSDPVDGTYGQFLDWLNDQYGNDTPTIYEYEYADSRWMRVIERETVAKACSSSSLIVCTHWYGETYKDGEVLGTGTISAFSRTGATQWVTDLGIHEASGLRRRAVFAEKSATSNAIFVLYDIPETTDLLPVTSSTRTLADIGRSGPIGGVARLDTDGNIVWIKDFEGEKSDATSYRNIIKTSRFYNLALFDDGGYMWCTHRITTDGVAMQKVSYEGNILKTVSRGQFNLDILVEPNGPNAQHRELFNTPVEDLTFASELPPFFRVRKIGDRLAVMPYAYSRGYKLLFFDPVSGTTATTRLKDPYVELCYFNDIISRGGNSFALGIQRPSDKYNPYYLINDNLGNLPYEPGFWGSEDMKQVACRTGRWPNPFVPPVDDDIIVNRGYFFADSSWNDTQALSTGAIDIGPALFHLTEGSSTILSVVSRRIRNPKFQARKLDPLSGRPERIPSGFYWYTEPVIDWYSLYAPIQQFNVPANGKPGWGNLSGWNIGRFNGFGIHEAPFRYDPILYGNDPEHYGDYKNNPSEDILIGYNNDYVGISDAAGVGGSLLLARQGIASANNVWSNNPDYENCCLLFVGGAPNYQISWKSEKMIPLDFPSGSSTPIARGDVGYGYCIQHSVHYFPAG